MVMIVDNDGKIHAEYSFIWLSMPQGKATPGSRSHTDDDRTSDDGDDFWHGPSLIEVSRELDY